MQASVTELSSPAVGRQFWTSRKGAAHRHANNRRLGPRHHGSFQVRYEASNRSTTDSYRCARDDKKKVFPRWLWWPTAKKPNRQSRRKVSRTRLKSFFLFHNIQIASTGMLLSRNIVRTNASTGYTWKPVELGVKLTRLRSKMVRVNLTSPSKVSLSCHSENPTKNIHTKTSFRGNEAARLQDCRHVKVRTMFRALRPHMMLTNMKNTC
jgi:hypothetical protein